MTGEEYPVSEQVIEAIAAETEMNPMDLPLLYEALDPDALDALIKTLSDGEITFQYAEFTVTVQSTGRVHLE